MELLALTALVFGLFIVNAAFSQWRARRRIARRYTDSWHQTVGTRGTPRDNEKLL